MDEIKKQKILLHSCCGPCSSSVIMTLKEQFDISIFYYNPNIYPEEEYLHRKSEQIRLIKMLNKEGEDIKIVDAEYDPETFEKYVCGLENEKEGGARCTKCFRLRLEKTGKVAKEKGFDIFGTTLTVSPHKNATLINQIGAELEQELGINFLVADFKKKDGFKKSIELSRKYDLYRQVYCGCLFSSPFSSRISHD